ncbi:GNAT family N-acetyltransferase [Nocardioides sp. LHG3406-4]|uniref:GNAT family N-acetyltransferase n=1 Tax=Nocardioides sp. LHG3406-4 TaxID=2804575 RepID=UPI003CE8CD70
MVAVAVMGADEPQQSTLPALSTDRLELRPVEEADLGLLIQLNSDPAVMTHIRGRAATITETRAEWSQRLTRQSNPARGLGYWLGFEDAEFVGWWSASWFAPRPETSGIGYRLCTAGWGRGLATEGARAMVGQAFADPGIERVFASTKSGNTRSRRVLEKLAMTHTATWTRAGDDRLLDSEYDEVGYELSRADWRTQRRRTARADPGVPE